MAVLAVAAVLAGCSASRKTAQLSILNEFIGTMMYVPDEEGSDPELEPEPTVYTVRKGDEVEGLKILSVTDREVRVQTYFEYDDGKRFGREFTVKIGETIRLTEVGLMDASHTYTVTYLQN